MKFLHLKKIHIQAGLICIAGMLACKPASKAPDQGSLTAFGLASEVDPLIGTENGGNVFVGANLPFGMVKLGPDCDGHFNTGYTVDTRLQGFSHTHVSGTGGGAKYGNVLVVPTTGSLNVQDYGSKRANERVWPGYYGVELKDYRVKAELTATQKAGFHRYTFLEGGESHILVDAGHYLFFGEMWGEGPTGEAQDFVGSEVEIISDTEVRGYTRVRNGWNYGEGYTVYFFARFDTPASGVGTWKNEKVTAGNRLETDSGEKSGAYFTFKTEAGQAIRLKVGISFVSTHKARQNLEQEISGWDFDAVATAANEAWNRELGRIVLEGGSSSDRAMFYTAFFHAMMMPVDRTGENPDWVSDEPYYDDFYAIWDTYRATHPLLTLVNESRQADMLRALVDIYRYEGYMPDARSGNDNGRTQGGSNCDILVADAFVKGIKGIDYETAYQAMVKNAEIPPGGDERKHGRGGLEAYNDLGYVPAAFEIQENKSFKPKLYERAGTRTVEFSACDFAIATLAQGLNKPQDAAKYLSRSSNWKNLWRPVADHGANGFIWPRRKDGSWLEPYTLLTGGSWGNFFYESHSWEYSLSIPHDVPGLIAASGGAKAFEARLDTFFGKNFYQVSNEPGFLTPCLYHYIGRPDKSVAQVRRIIRTHYHTGRGGIPGNDDSGSMSAWLLFHAMGFYPNAGQDLYLITSPLFERVVIAMDNGKKLEVKAANFSEKNLFVQSVNLNGQPLDRNWFRHTEIREGGTLELVMGETPTAWGRTSPPSGL